MGTRAFYRKPGILAALAAVFLGWLLLLPLITPNPLVRWSCDLLQLVLPGHHLTNLAIVHMDEQAMQDYNQQPGEQWSRSIHARLLDRLTRDQPRVVVFDIAMTATSNLAADAEFSRALRRNGRVVLAGGKVPVTGIPLSYTVIPPLDKFETNAHWGTAKVLKDPDQVGRRYLSGDTEEVGLAWAAAAIAGAPVTQNPDRRLTEERWLNYYGSSRPFEGLSMTYANAETRETNFFRDKAVFIGGKPDTLERGDITDVFYTPFTKWNDSFIPGVEVIAIAYANLVNEDWLRRTGIWAELGLLLVTGALAGMGLQKVLWRTAVWLAGSLVVLTIAASITVVLSTLFWFPWLIVVAVQIPCALIFRLSVVRDEVVAASAALAEAARSKALQEEQENLAATVQDGRPEIPDHDLIRCVGEGAYGQVWIARNAIDLYHAVKVVYRSRFGMEAPYERALRGIQNFMPISRSHEGFVHILHVGRNDRAKFFFYIMEAGDDVKAGQKIDPATYAPKTLASELRVRGAIPPRESLEFMLALTDAVERLHQHQLIHRDIKPGNIIFVNGRPKLADIDLVTSLSGQGEVSQIGTEGYMAPEGPGTASADAFSLGRVFYVALTGKPPAHCPELPTQVTNHPECSLFMDLNYIICKACEFDASRRYASAALMHADLLGVARRLGM